MRESYTVGFLYVTGTVTASSGNSGIITGYQIDHNVGTLAPIDGLPVSTGGANPVRAVLTLGSRFLYVLNRGVNNAGNGSCYGVGSAKCQNANITEFRRRQWHPDAPGNLLHPGPEPVPAYRRLLGQLFDGSGPRRARQRQPVEHRQLRGALGGGTTTCGDITIFQINQTTGRLSLVVNAQVTASNGSALTYFPVPANPIDFVLSGQFLLTLTGASAPTFYPYTGSTSVWPYSYPSNGQLTLSQNSVQPLGIHQGNAIVNANSVIYVLDNEPLTITCSSSTCPFPRRHLPQTDSALHHGHRRRVAAPDPAAAFPDTGTLANPIQLLVKSKGKYLYVANLGTNTPETTRRAASPGTIFHRAFL